MFKSLAINITVSDYEPSTKNDELLEKIVRSDKVVMKVAEHIAKGERRGAFVYYSDDLDLAVIWSTATVVDM
ncbi:hypothetical protein HRF84_08540 [Klebsiella variicola]|uniref:hypothetical protein n=1 Tax=Klebsiella variicola TaxID=244366 RepID=UPI00156072D0|nr:hypothetical protein [Klebsiella variicola]NRE95088.1 hypothetical protein [Klebsiella variicola]HDY9206442.1 hypothetical protein [Klebsiella pneumoniae]